MLILLAPVLTPASGTIASKKSEAAGFAHFIIPCSIFVIRYSLTPPLQPNRPPGKPATECGEDNVVAFF